MCHVINVILTQLSEKHGGKTSRSLDKASLDKTSLLIIFTRQILTLSNILCICVKLINEFIIFLSDKTALTGLNTAL